MEQREILVNRQEFLHNEKMAVTSKISQSKAKNDLLERKKLQEKVKLASEKEFKREEDYNKFGKPLAGIVLAEKTRRLFGWNFCMSNIVDGNKSNLGQIGHVKDGSFKSSQAKI